MTLPRISSFIAKVLVVKFVATLLQKKKLKLTASLLLLSCSRNFCRSLSLSLAESCVDVGVAGAGDAWWLDGGTGLGVPTGVWGEDDDGGAIGVGGLEDTFVVLTVNWSRLEC